MNYYVEIDSKPLKLYNSRMLQDFKDVLNRWNGTTSERQKLQHAYITLTVVVILIAGVVSLVRVDLGHDIMRVALIAIVTFLVNAFVWNLLSSVILSKLSARPKKK